MKKLWSVYVTIAVLVFSFAFPVGGHPPAVWALRALNWLASTLANFG